MELSDEQVKQLNDLGNFLKFKQTWAFKKLINSQDKVTALFTGNQFGKTAGVAMQYVMRILGIHPITERNVSYKKCSLGCGKTWKMFEQDEECECGGSVIIHPRITKTFRFCSETLPGSGKNDTGGEGATEVKNTQYPAIKKWLPGFFFFLACFLASVNAITIACFCGFPLCISSFMFSLTTFFELPFLSGIFSLHKKFTHKQQ